MSLDEFMRLQEEAHVFTTLVHTTELMEEHGVYAVLLDLHTITDNVAVKDALGHVLNTLLVKH